jgi:glycosyltransferase involved in cell wall biosynthesis
MKIVYFYQYFTTPKGSYGTRVYEFTSEWVKKGYEVEVVTSLYSKSDLKAEKFIEQQIHNGVKVRVLNVKVDNKQSFVMRIWSFIAYAILSSYYALTLKCDIVVASSGPITVGLPGLLAKYIRGKKLVFEVRDLWPEGAIELGIIKNPVIKSLSYWFEKKCYKASSLIVSLSPGMQSYIEKNHGHKNVISVTNSANIDLFSTPAVFNPPKELVDKKYAIYTGNIGNVNNSYWLFNAAKVLKNKNREDIKILLVGDGQQREELVEKAKIEGVDTFLHFGLMPKKDLIPLIQNAIVSLVPLKGTPVLDTSSPNKFFESLAAGVPVIQNTQGWMKEFLIQHHVGYTLNPNNENELADLLIDLVDHPDKLNQMKINAKEIAKKEFDKNYLAEKMLNTIIEINKNAI